MESLGVFAQDFCCYFHLCKCVTIGCHVKEIYVQQFQDWNVFHLIYIQYLWNVKTLDVI